MTALDRLHRMMSDLDGPVTRKWLKNQIKALEGSVASEPTTKTETPTPDIAPISVLLLTPSDAAVTELTKEKRPDRDCEAVCLGQAVAENAVMLVAARTANLLRMSSILKLWKFKRFSQIVLLANPATPDISDVPALGLCELGDSKLVTHLSDWSGLEDLVELADKITAGIGGRRVHLFAESQAEGWDALVGDDNWVRAKTSS